MQALTSSTFRTPTTHIPPAAYRSGLPTHPLFLVGSLPPPTHIPPVAYPSELPNPRPLPPMSALEESITEILQCPYYNFKET